MGIISFNIGQRWKKTDQVCPNCTESKLKEDKMSDVLRLKCFNCGFEYFDNKINKKNL